jgi:pSer/pThr/pTyr-binding forkhead associated (FHA) protein
MSDLGSTAEQRPGGGSEGRQLNNDGDPLARHSQSPSDLKQLLAAERTGEPFLVFRGQDGRLGLFAPGRGGQTRTVGRRPEMDLSIDWDTGVSGVHAELQGLGSEWTIVDDGLSTNGTYVNGQRVSGRQRLRDDDRIRIGRTILVYKAGGTAPVQETTTAGDASSIQELTDTQRNVLIALCRPYHDRGNFAAPASNQQIADELFLSVDAVKMHLSRLFANFELADVPQNQKRARLAECVLQFGLISERDLR